MIPTPMVSRFYTPASLSIMKWPIQYPSQSQTQSQSRNLRPIYPPPPPPPLLPLNTMVTACTFYPAVSRSTTTSTVFSRSVVTDADSQVSSHLIFVNGDNFLGSTSSSLFGVSLFYDRMPAPLPTSFDRLSRRTLQWLFFTNVILPDVIHLLPIILLKLLSLMHSP